MNSRAKEIAVIAALAAFMAVVSPWSIPLPGSDVGFSLATFAVYLVGGLTDKWRGAACIAVYIMLGILGLPVFMGGTAGVGMLAGPRGGFIIGYLAAAAVIPFCKKILPKKTAFTLLAMAAGAVCIFIMGTVWFMISTGRGLPEALTICVLPFIPFDIIKIILAAQLVKRLEKTNILQGFISA